MNDLTDMACQELVEVITDYIEGSMDPIDRERFERHLAECPGCRDYVEQMRLTIRLTRMLRPESLSASTRQDLLRAFRGWRRGRDEPSPGG